MLRLHCRLLVRNSSFSEPFHPCATAVPGQVNSVLMSIIYQVALATLGTKIRDLVLLLVDSVYPSPTNNPFPSVYQNGTMQGVREGGSHMNGYGSQFIVTEVNLCHAVCLTYLITIFRRVQGYYSQA